VGVDLQRLQRQVVDASRQYGKMAGGQYPNVAHEHVAAAFEGDRLVSDPGRIGRRQARFSRFASTQAPAADETRSNDCDVVDVLAPDQAVVPMVMTEVLVAFEWCIRFGGVKAIAWGPQNDSAHLKMQCDITFEMN